MKGFRVVTPGVYVVKSVFLYPVRYQCTNYISNKKTGNGCPRGAERRKAFRTRVELLFPLRIKTHSRYFIMFLGMWFGGRALSVHKDA